MSKSKRLLELMMTVNSKRKFTVRELAEEFGVSYRTILRDLQELSEIGIPLYSEVGVHGGYQVVKERILPPIAFSEKEAVAMFFAYQSLQFYGSLPFDAEARSALKKFYQYLPKDVKEQIDRMRERIVFWNPNREQPSEYLKVILEAAVEKRMIVIEYDSAKGVSERRILPVGLYTYNGYWFCPAYCLQQEDFRLFRADRIRSAKVVPQAEVEERVNRLLRQVSLYDWLKTDAEESNAMPLKLRLTREGIRRVQSDLWLGQQIENLEDGTGRIETTLPSRKLEYCASLIWSLGTEVYVEEPEEVIWLLKEQLIRMQRHLDSYTECETKWGDTRND